MCRRRRRRAVEVEAVVEVVAVVIIVGRHGMDRGATQLLGGGWGMFQGLAGPKDAGFKLHAADILIARSKTSPRSFAKLFHDIVEAILGSMR